MDSGPTKVWIKRRKLTMLASAFLDLLIGFEYSMYVINLWFYLTEMVPTNNQRFWYACISVAYLLSTAGFSIPICRFADKTRRIKLISFLCCSSYIVGNVIYAIPFSPFNALCGRIIAGVGSSLQSVTAGELARSYPDDQTARIFSIIGSANALGFMLAPGFNIAFSKVDIRWQNFHITYANASGISIPVLFLLGMLVIVFMVSDLSRTYDLKKESKSLLANREIGSILQNGNTDVDSDDEIEPYDPAMPLQAENENTSLLTFWKKLFTNFDIAILLFLQFWESGVVLFLNMLFPIIVSEKLHWSHTTYNIIMIAETVCVMVPCIYLMFRTLTDKTIFYISAPSILVYAVLVLAQTLWSMEIASKQVDTALGVIFSMGFGVLLLVRDVFVRSFLAKMVASRHQSSVDSVRNAVAKIGSVIATLAAPYAVNYMEIVGSTLMSFIVMYALLVCSRGKTLKSPAVIIK